MCLWYIWGCCQLGKTAVKLLNWISSLHPLGSTTSGTGPSRRRHLCSHSFYFTTENCSKVRKQWEVIYTPSSLYPLWSWGVKRGNTDKPCIGNTHLTAHRPVWSTSVWPWSDHCSSYKGLRSWLDLKAKKLFCKLFTKWSCREQRRDPWLSSPSWSNPVGSLSWLVQHRWPWTFSCTGSVASGLCLEARTCPWLLFIPQGSPDS